MQMIDLSGIWKVYATDGIFLGEVTLPGSSCEGKIGEEAHYYEVYAKETVRAPKEKFEYIGPLIYEREIEIPDDFEGMSLSVYFERVNFASKLWIDGIQIGRGVVSLSTPHIYALTDRVDSTGRKLFSKLAGKHILRLEIDNRNFLNLGDMSSGYSVDTQGYWNGVIGRMELQAQEICHIEQVQVYPKDNGIQIKTVTISDRHIPLEITKATLQYQLTLPNGSVKEIAEQSVELFSKRQSCHFFLPLSEAEKFVWNEFLPNLYSLQVTLSTEKSSSSYIQSFGYRILSVENKQFTLNHRAISLRGTINCAQYPLTGYPPMDLEIWKQHFTTFRAYGLNHVRCHAWCPPEAAFQAADELGIYLSVEMPLWLNRDVTPMEFGDDEWHSFYFRQEGLRILETFGNHPSFCFFPNGNENLGDYTMLENMTMEFKALDQRHLYTLTSNFDHPLSPAEDYLSAFEIAHFKARIQFLHDEVGQATNVNYEEMAKAVPVPFASFEVGQYCVYPNVDLCERYTGNMLPVNFDMIRKMMKEHKVYHRLQEYILASGDLAAKLYKEDIEAVLRTKGMGGFQLLSFVDYTGQSTATVGLLDIFHESKGIISPDQWKYFCNDVVPLLEARRVFYCDEDFSGYLSLYDYGEEPIEEPVYEMKLMHDGFVIEEYVFFGQGKIPFSIPLSFATENMLLYVEVTVKHRKRRYTNNWRIFVYQKEHRDILARYLTTPEEVAEASVKGGTYIASPSAFPLEHYAKNSFVPVFWSPVHFPSEAPTGAMIQADHEAFGSFPTEKYIDYQWKYLLEHSVAMDISGKTDIDVIMEMVPNYVDNVPKSPLFVIQQGKAKLLFCGFDLNQEDIATKALKQSLEAYCNKL